MIFKNHEGDDDDDDVDDENLGAKISDFGENFEKKTWISAKISDCDENPGAEPRCPKKWVILFRSTVTLNVISIYLVSLVMLVPNRFLY